MALEPDPRVSSITVTGAHHPVPDAVRAATGLAGRPIFSTSAAGASRAIAALPAVREARVTLLLPNTARVEVVEREAIGRWLIGDVEYYVDADGYLFGSVDPAGAPALRVADDRDATRLCASLGPQACVDPAVVEAAFRLARIKPGELRADLVRPEVRIDRGALGLVLRSGSGWEVRFGGADRLDEKLALARRFLADNATRRLDYLDVRSADRIVFSPTN